MTSERADPIEIVPDSERRGLIGVLPLAIRPYASLMRLDRPIGAWLLFWPGAWAIALAGLDSQSPGLLLLFATGAVAMRSAGCVYNDIVDRDLDRQVERTRLRPLASGRVGVKGAWLLLIGLCLIGLAVLLQLNAAAQLVALASLPLVAAYPFMKRISWWPQAWLGLVFSWAALAGWAAATGELTRTGVLLWAGSVFWVVGYDTIYALQDREDDALIGVRSSALALGRRVRTGLACFYLLALAGWSMAVWQVRADLLGLAALAPLALHLAWQVFTLKPDDGGDALLKFRSNRLAGLLMFLGCLVIGAA